MKRYLHSCYINRRLVFPKGAAPFYTLKRIPALLLLLLFSGYLHAEISNVSVTPSTTSPVTIDVSTSISASMTVTTSGNGNNNNWGSIGYEIVASGGSQTGYTCIPNLGFDEAGDHTQDFTMASPTTNGTFDVYYAAYNGSSCNGGVDATSTQTSAVFTPADNTAPTLDTASAADCANLNQVTLTFSETLDTTSAQTASNYSIDGGPSITSAVRQADGVTVILTTASDLTSPATYTNLNVSGVKDLAGNTMAAYASPLTVPDCSTVGPTLDDVATTCADATQLTLTFSKALDQTTAETTGNYSIDSGITISSAVLQADGLTVILTTSAFSDLTTYTLDTSGITDTSANTMTPYSDTFTYPNCTGSFPYDQCAAERYGADLGCTAADVSITGLSLGAGSPTRCEGGTTFSVNLEVTVNFATPDRQDIGIFFSKDGKLPDTTIASGGATSCTVGVLPTTLPFLNLDPGPDGSGVTDTCGDGNGTINSGTGTGVHYMSNVEVPCQANPISDGGLFIPFVVTWDSQKTPSGSTCTGNVDPVPSTKSKCNAPDVSLPAEVALTTIDVVVMPKITIADAISAIRVGNSTTYTVTIENTTGADLSNAILKSPIIGGLTNYALTGCTVTGGATCPAVNATTLASIQDSVNGLTLSTMPADSTIIFTISADMTSAPDDVLTNQASITVTRPTAGTTQTETASDINTILPHHYSITYPNGTTGITCEASPVTITSHRDDTDHNRTTPPSALTTITLSTSAAIDSWSLNAGQGTFTTPNLYTFDGTETSVVLWLNQSTASTIDIDILDNVADNAGGFASDIDGDTDEDADIEFRQSVFRFVDPNTSTPRATMIIGSQVAGMPSSILNAQTIGLQPIETNTITNECEVSFADKSVAVGLAYLCNDPALAACNAAADLSLSPLDTYSAVGSTSLTGSNNSGSLNYTSVLLEFNAAGIASLSFIYSDAGSIRLYADKTLIADAGASTPVSGDTLQGFSNDFVVRPFGFDIDFTNDRFINGIAGTSYSADASGSKYLTAGSDFVATISAVLWEAADDANNDGIPDAGANLTGNGPTPSFGQEGTAPSIIFDYSLTAPAGDGGQLTVSNVGTTGTMDSASTITLPFTNAEFTSGVTTTTMNWDEVGIIDITADLSDYLGSGTNISGSAINVGRFTPQSFAVVINAGTLDNTINSTFTYVGEGFGYSSGLEPTYTVYPLNITQSIWTENGSYSVGDYVVEPDRSNGTTSLRVYQVTASDGAAGTTEPAWPSSGIGFSVDGVTYTDLGVVGPDDLGSLAYYVTQNYAVNSGEYSKIANIHFTTTVSSSFVDTHSNTQNATNDAGGVAAAGTLGAATYNVGGTLTFALTGGDFEITKATDPVAPFTADIDLTLTTFTDSDGISSGPVSAIFTPSGNNLRYGRVYFSDAYGSSVSPATTSLPLILEHFDGTSWITNPDETSSGSSFSTTQISCSDPDTSDTLVCSTDTSPVDGTLDRLTHDIALTQGVSVVLTADGNSGSLIYDLDLSAAGADKTFLRFDWDGDGTEEDPAASVLFYPVYRGDDRFLFWKEVEEAN